MASFDLSTTSRLGRFSRREFLRRSAIAAGVGVAAPFALDLTGLSFGASETATAATDYRALVCVFLAGGNDHWNMVVPSDASSHAAYAAARPGLGVRFDAILSISPHGGFRGAGELGFSPHLSGVHSLFAAGNAAVVANIGTLIKPVTKAEAMSLPNVPAQLKSHNDQQSMWQSSAPEGATAGWGGKIADLMLDANGRGQAFTSISVSGNAVMMTGDSALQYQVSSAGVTKLRTDCLRGDIADEALRRAMSLAANGSFPSAIVDTTRRGLNAADEISAALDAVDGAQDFAAAFGVEASALRTGSLASQLHMVARLIAAGRDHLGLKRQVFIVKVGGFDSHDDLATGHPAQLQGLDRGLADFYAATALIGATKQVTSFTASEFSRTLSTNGTGSDHGWGGHQLVVGGALDGNRVVGTVPATALDGPDSFDRGELVPTTAVDQYAATFATWMGAGSNELEAVVPNIGRFAAADLGLFVPEPVPDAEQNPDPDPDTQPVPDTQPIRDPGTNGGSGAVGGGGRMPGSVEAGGLRRAKRMSVGG